MVVQAFNAFKTNMSLLLFFQLYTCSADLFRFLMHLRTPNFLVYLREPWVVNPRVWRLCFVSVRLIVIGPRLWFECRLHGFAKLWVFQKFNGSYFGNSKLSVPFFFLLILHLSVLVDFVNFSLEVDLYVLLILIALIGIVRIDLLKVFDLMLAWLLEKDVLTDCRLAVAREHRQISAVVFVVVVLDC